MEVEENFSSLSIEDRLNHKLWKARLCAYEELAKLFRNSIDPKEAVFRDYFDHMRKAPVEPNAAVLDAALCSLLAFLECADPTTSLKLRPAIISPLVEKGLSSTRASTKTRALDIILEFVALDSADVIVTELSTFLTHKQPKLVAASINALSELIKNFGIQVISVKPVIKLIPAIFQHSDKTVRVEGTALVLELSRWIGSSVSAGFDGLKPVQIKELQDLMLKSTPSKPVPSRWKRGEGPAVALATQGSLNSVDAEPVGVDVDGSCGSVTEIIDAYSISEPVNVLEKIPSTLTELIESPKWKDRKEALDSLLSVLKVPKIQEGSFGPLVSILTKKIADVNVSVVISAAQCIEALGNGLRKGFSPHKTETISVLLERCKEKNKMVIESLKLALDSMIYCLSSITDIAELFGSYLKHKNPQVRSETLLWISRCIPKLFKQAHAKKEIKIISDTIIHCLDDSVSDVRDSSSIVLGSLIKITGEKNVLPFLDQVDKLKLAKILELAAKDEKENRSNPNIAVDKPSAGKIPVDQPIKVPAKETRPVVAPKPSSCSPEVSAAQASFAQTNESATDIFRRIFGDAKVDGLSDPNWKSRLESVEHISQRLETGIPAEIDSEILVRSLSCSPGWKESNVQVFAKMLSILASFAEKSSFTLEGASLAVPFLVEKISDPKLGIGIGLFFTSVALRIGLGRVIAILLEPAKGIKNPKSLSEIYNWLATNILDFGLLGIDFKPLIDFLKLGIAHSNVTVRSSAIKAAVNIRRYHGKVSISFYSDLAPAQLAVLETEFKKVEDDPVPVPTKAITIHPTQKIIEGGNRMELDTCAHVEVDEAIPRNDITSSLCPLITELSDPSWKVRKEAMDKALTIINRNSCRVKISNNEFLSELKNRFADANKNLISQALELGAAMASAMGQSFEKSGALRVLLGPATNTLCDNKPQVRAAALKLLSAILDTCSTSSFMGCIAGSLSTDSPNLRRELLTWIADKARLFGKVSEEDTTLLVSSIIQCYQDRTIEVRKATSLCLDSLIDTFSSDTILHICQSQKGFFLPQVKQLIDSHIPTSDSGLPNARHRTPQKAPGTTTHTPTAKASELLGIVFIVKDHQVKNARLENESKNGVKWVFDTPRVDLCDSLKAQMNGHLSSSIVKQLFSVDFKDFISALSHIDTAIIETKEIDGLISNLDIILKYLAIRLYDTNTSVLMKTFDVLEHALSVIDEGNLRLSEAEANYFIPHFVQRSGEMKEPIKGRLRGIYRQFCRVYPASKIVAHLIDGLKSKNSRVRVECLVEIGVLITRNGLMVVQPNRHVPCIAGCISDRDSQVRNAALNVLVHLSDLLGDALLKNMTDVPQKDLDLFNERLKRAKDKTLPLQMEIDIPEAECSEDTVTNDDMLTNYSAEIPKVFSLDVEQLGSPSNKSAPLRQSVCATPLNPTLSTAPTPALPYLSNPFYEPQSPDDPLERVIQQLSSSTDLECITALQRLDEILVTPQIIAPKIGPLMSALVVRLHECTHSMIDVDCSLKSRLCRYVTNALILLISDKSRIIKELDFDSLTLLLKETLSILVSDQIALMEDKDHLCKAFNAQLIKSLENCDINLCYRSLIRLLEQAFRVPSSIENKYPEYIMKCLWKLTKTLPSQIKAGEIQVAPLLVEIHLFFNSLPPIEWKSRAAQGFPMNDLPLRTIKTILHELVSTLGSELIPIVLGIENFSQSFVTSYLKAMLSANNVDVSALEASFDSTQPTQQSYQISAEELETSLKDICSKICSKPNTRSGLLELYHLQKAHPYALEFINSYLEKLGNFFYKYIKRNLAQIESENQQDLSRDQTNTGGTSFFKSRLSALAPIEAYKQRLAQMQTEMFGRGGLVTDHSEAHQQTQMEIDTLQMSPVRKRLDSPLAKPSGRSPLAPSAISHHDATRDPHTPSKDSTIMSLKERLARLRQGTND